VRDVRHEDPAQRARRAQRALVPELPEMKELTLTELRRIARVLGAAHAGARIVKIVQPGPTELALLLDRPERRWLGLSARPRAARIGALAEAPAAPPSPPAFAQYLRAHFEGARLAAASVEGEDRLLRLRFEPAGSLLLSVLGPRSNLHALDAEDRVAAALRPLAETRRDLALGAAWQSAPGGPPSAGEDRFAAVPDEALLAEVERAFAAAAAVAEEADLGRRVAQALRKQRASLDKKLALIEQDLGAQAEAERLARQGELLKAHLREVKAGQGSIALRDFATGEPVEIALDPKLTASANLEEIFKRARKAEKRARKAAADVDAVRERIAALDALAAEASAAGGGEALAAFAARPEVARLLERFAPPPVAPSAPEAPKKRVFRLGKTELPTRLCPKVYTTADGLEIWVGKNDEGNDVLTTRLARGNDLFFHLEGSPGSHVILRTEGKTDPPSESLLDAAELAVAFSKAKHATRASVHIAAVKDISKPSGAKPGLVYVHRGRTIQLRRDPKRLERVLASRTEE
jgi:predicted ribosome quality control (RQC) complex YloA/Tae2 family protein